MVLNTSIRRSCPNYCKGWRPEGHGPSLRKRAVYNSQCCARYWARVLQGHLSEPRRPWGVSRGSDTWVLTVWCSGSWEHAGGDDGREDRRSGQGQTLHGHSRESVLSTGGREEAVKDSGQRRDRIRFLLQKQLSRQPCRECNGVGEDQRWGDDSVTYYSNTGLSELRHPTWEWEDRTDAREMTELNFTGLADWWWVRNEAEKKAMTRYQVLSVSSAFKVTGLELSLSHTTLLNPMQTRQDRYHLPLSQTRAQTWEISDFPSHTQGEGWLCAWAQVGLTSEPVSSPTSDWARLLTWATGQRVGQLAWRG